ncbi:YqaE/Pmp3 family membrane protein [Autumnicola musiva]|uniref:YqaE/Pmp3 family membrane protein n=1 Tax=Autumnicola musiva TaxID=3075589 RepID=A0ABU3D695_9FLAO|nr:YqaE/Pmp3 family membrane protein [Zunongwangia sp. F117]MDT0676909.1 YqaE/Pmp3 family membrane protein [Zunongwangia sp. F117]
MSVLTIILNILLPPLAVYMKHGVGSTLLISIILTIIGWIPGVIHAFLVNGTK